MLGMQFTEAGNKKYLEGDYEQLVINETIDGLFSSYRIDRNSLPKGFFLYEIRWDDSLSSLAEISPSVVVNHAGSFITKSPLEFDANNSIRITYANFVEFCNFIKARTASPRASISPRRASCAWRHA